MKTLILSCNTGGGHNAAGRSIANNLEALNQPCTFLDALSLSGEKYSNYVSKLYSALVNNMPNTFGAIYRISENMSRPTKGPRLCWITRSFQAKLLAYIEDGDFDIIVTTHFFVAQVLTILQAEDKLTLPVVAIITDYTCGPFWEETTCDYYVIPHSDLISEFSERGVPIEKLRPLGIPVNTIFSNKANSSVAKSLIGIDPNLPMILMMSGSMGHGDISKRVKEILNQAPSYSCKNDVINPDSSNSISTNNLINSVYHDSFESQVFPIDSSHINERSSANFTDIVSIVIICGNNEDLQEKLAKKFKKCPNVIIKGYEKNIPQYMDACDVLLTKPGGLTSTEAAVKNVPLIHVDAIPGCETKNADFFQERNMSFIGSTIEEEAHIALSLCFDKAICNRMIKAQATHINPHTATDISNLLIELTNS